jgi:diacylglycerol O-acyltransferase
MPTAAELLEDNLRRRLRSLRRGLARLAHPSGKRRAAARVWREFLAERVPSTSLNRPIGRDRRLAVVRARLEVARQVAHAHQAKVNDVALAAVAGGLRRLLAGRGEDPDGLVLRVMVPVSLHRERPGRASGNQDSVMLVPPPVGEPDPVRRLELIAAETAVRKRDLRPQMGGGLMGLTAVQRAWYRALARQRTVNLSVTNVPGPPAPRHLAGALLLELFPVVSLRATSPWRSPCCPTPGSSTSPPSPTATPAPTWRCSPAACGTPSTASPGRRSCRRSCTNRRRDRPGLDGM